MHRLKNGHPAHVLTDDDRRKAAAVTNAMRREKRALVEQLRHEREINDLLRRDTERRARRREKLRRWRDERRERELVDVWLERGYGTRLPCDPHSPKDR